MCVEKTDLVGCAAQANGGSSTLLDWYDPRYWVNIAGNMAATQLSLITALMIRNNIISRESLPSV